MHFKEYDYLKYKDTKFTVSMARGIYKDLCKFANGRHWDNTIYGEWHHIKPKSMGGSNSKRNLIKITYAEHLFAHYLLAIIYPKSSMTFAFHYMTSIAKSNNNITIEDFKLLEKLRIEFVNMDRKGNVLYTYTDKELTNLRDNALEYLHDNNVQHYTMNDMVELLNLPSVYVFTNQVLNPLIDSGKIGCDIFQFGSRTRYDDTKIETIQQDILNLVGDYYNSKHITMGYLKRLYSMSEETLLYKIIQPLIDSGKLYKHAFHFGRSKKYDDDDIRDLVMETKLILINRRVNIGYICKALHIKLDTFIKRVKPLIENSHEYKTRLLTTVERIYSIKINNIVLTDRTKNEIQEYFDKHNIRYINVNGRVRLARAFANNLCKIYKGEIIRVTIANESDYKYR